MADKQTAQTRIIELLEEDMRSIPFIVGYLTHDMDAPTCNGAVDAYLEHDEKITQMVEAMRRARQAAEDLQE